MYEKLGPSRLQTWTLESRVRYALVQVGIAILIVGGMSVAFGSLSLPRDLLFAIPIALLALLVHGFIWYPRAKRKLTDPSRLG